METLQQQTERLVRQIMDEAFAAFFAEGQQPPDARALEERIRGELAQAEERAKQRILEAMEQVAGV
jgi:guanylate kinase